VEVDGLDYITTWLAKERKVLPILKRVLEDLRISFDGRGTGWHGTPSFEQIQGALATSNVRGSVVPGNKIRIIPWGCAWHNDPAGLPMSLEIRHTTPLGTFNIMVKDTQSVANGYYLTTNRTLVIPPNGQFGAESIGVAPAAGKSLNINYIYYEVDPGDYVLNC